MNTQQNRLHDFLEQGVYDIETFQERQQLIVTRIRKAEEQLKENGDEIEQEKIRKKQQNYLRNPARSKRIHQTPSK